MHSRIATLDLFNYSVPLVLTTNLDLHQSEDWCKSFKVLPRVGDYIGSSRRWGWHSQRQIELTPNVVLELVVTRILHHSCGNIEIEMHLPPHRFESLRSFYKDFYGPLTGGCYI